MNRPSILTALFTTVVSLFSVPVASAQVTLTSINTTLGGTSITTPQGSYVDVYGNIYALSANGATAVEIPANGGPLVTLATGLVSARGIAADSLGNVYVSQIGVGSILKIAPNLTTSTIGSGLQRPFLMTVDSSNNLYIANSTPGTVTKITPSGTQTTIVFTGMTNNHGVAVDSAGNVYTDSYLSSTTTALISEMSPTGVQTTVPITGLNDPYGLALDASGNLYVIDASGRLLEFSPPFTASSQPIALVSGLGTTTVSVALSPRGDIVYNNTAKVYALQSVSNLYGTTVGATSGASALTFTFATAKTLGTPVASFLSNNSATVQFKDGGSDTCTSGKSILAGGTCVLNVVFTPLQAGPVAGAINLVDNAANILASAFLTGVGDAPVPVFSAGTQSNLLNSLGSPTGVAIDAGGNAYVADTTKNTVTKIGSGGTATTLSFTGLARPTGVTVDGAGAVYVSDTINNAIYKLTAAGVQTTVATTGLSAPKGIALDGLNNLYIADSGNKRVVKVDIFGNQTVVGLTGLASPAFVAVDAAEDIFVSDTGKVYELPFDGTQTTLSPAGLSAAAGIAVDASGTVYIADSGKGDVVVSPPAGSSFTLASGLTSPAGVAIAANGSLYIASTGGGQLVLLDRTKETLAFPATAVGATSPAMTAAVQNAGNATLSISGVAVSSGFSQVTPLAATDCNAGSSLGASAICNVNITFSPASLGSTTGTMTLTDNALNVASTTQTIALSGTATRATSVSLVLTNPATGNPVYGQSPTVMATVAPSSGTGTPTGSVTFALDGGTPGAPASLSAGQAIFSPSGLSAGTHTVTAVYSGDISYAGSTSATFTVTVTSAALTVTAVSQSRMYGVANSTLTYTIAGYQYSDTSSVVSGVPALSTTATTTSSPGAYPIGISTGTLSAANYSFKSIAGTLTVTQATNTITFPPIANVTYGAYPITLAASSNSGLPVTYAVVSGNATVTNGAGAAVTITGVGAVTIAANQSGNTNYAGATQVTQSFTVAKAVLTATANSLSKQSGQANPALTYTLSGFVYSDTASAVSGTASLSTTAVTSSPSGTYPITIVAGTLAATDYSFTFVNATLTVTGNTAQTITFGALPNVVYGAGPIALTATASSNAAVSYMVTGPATLNVATSILAITGVGTVSVTASQAGNGTYAAATPVTQSFVVAPAVLLVAPANASRYINAPNPTFTYTISGYVNGDTAAVVSGAPSVTSTATTSSPTGTYPITATVGTLVAANYTFTFTTATLIVNPDPQSITFGTLPGVAYGVAPVTLTATANSSLPVTYTVTGPAVLNAAASTLTITGVGMVSVTASQAGNATYAAATPVVQSFVVAPAPLTVTVSNVTLPFGSAIPTTFAYVISGFQYSDTQAVVSGTPNITTTATSSSPGGPYPITAAAGSLAAANYSFANFVPGVLTITAAAQTITFAPLPNIPQTTTSLTLNATASSGLGVIFSETGTAPVTLANSVLTISGPGTVSVTASQPGNASYAAATPVVQTFNVTATTVTSLTLSTNTANVGTAITLTAKVTFTKAGTPTGTVSFYDGSTLLVPTSTSSPTAVPVTVSGLTATATLTTSSIPSGSTYVTAVYTGDTSYTGSASGATATPVLIVAPDFNVSATPSLLTIAHGQSGTSVLTITPVGGYSETITFSCPGIPSNLSCSFAPPALNFYPGTGTGTVAQSTTLTVTAAAITGQLVGAPRGYSIGTGVRDAGMFLSLPALALTLCFLRRRRWSSIRNLGAMALLALACGVLVGLSGCGAGSSSTGAGTYNLPVTLNDGSGVAHVVTVTVNVE